jgi:hypothetical protein
VLALCALPMLGGQRGRYKEEDILLRRSGL